MFDDLLIASRQPSAFTTIKTDSTLCEFPGAELIIDEIAIVHYCSGALELLKWPQRKNPFWLYNFVQR